MGKILIIDDDEKICLFLSHLVESLGHMAFVAYTLEDGLKAAMKNDCDVILLDFEFPEGNGAQILPELLDVPSKPEIIIITGTGGIGGAELAFKFGAWDYVQKPFVLHEVSLPISRALQYRQEKEIAKKPLPLHRAGIIGSSSALNRCLGIVGRASVTDASVLITGETGTGKELFARAIHENSQRNAGRFIVVDCGALPQTLAESILFGHRKGAFTGADRDREGLFLQAEGGTLFLDEVGELPLHIQTTLLRCLQEKRILPVGAKKEVPVDFRLVAATNRDLEKRVEEKKFREDLFYRIRAVEISLPPLRDRGNDIQEITINKVHQLAKQYGIPTKGVSPEFLEILNKQNWPGNVRELINVLEYAITFADKDPILYPKHLNYNYRSANSYSPSIEEVEVVNPFKHEFHDAEVPSLFEYRQKMEKKYFQMLLSHVKGDRKKACALSGISQSRFYGLLKKHSLSHVKS